MGVMLGALHRAEADVLLLLELLPDAAGTVGFRMTPTEGAVRLAGLSCAVDMLPGFVELAEEVGFLGIRQVAAAKLVFVHPVEGGPFIIERHFTDVPADFRMGLDDFIAVMAIYDSVMPDGDGLENLARAEDVFLQLAELRFGKRGDFGLEFRVCLQDYSGSLFHDDHAPFMLRPFLPAERGQETGFRDWARRSEVSAARARRSS